jgi:murein DD-endopeptidase MepM/ murein hydrolase activator NlpD
MSRFTRIILVNEEQQGVREFTISRSMVWCLAILGVLLAIVLGWVLVSFGSYVHKAAAVPRLQAEAAAARADLVRLNQLQDELHELKVLQERVLAMLGIDFLPAAADAETEDALHDDLHQLASLIMTPPPDTWPTAGYVTAEFSEGAVHRGERPHLGLDIAGPEGAPILAAGDGVVARAGEDPFLGNFVEIQHGLGYLTVYGHCASVAVARAERVRRGQVIAYLGATGQASAPHLHFEIWHHGTAVDPRQFLSGEPPAP